MKIGLLQLNLQPANLAANIELLFEAVQQASAKGAELCVSSELALCGGGPPTDILLRKSFIADCQEALSALAVRLDKAALSPLLVGAPIANPAPQGKSLHNGAVLLRNGKVIVIARKVLLSANGEHDDHYYFEPGVACGVLQHNGWRFAVTIGEDVWNDRGFWKNNRSFDTDPVEEFMGGGADALINMTAISYAQGRSLLHQRVLSWTASRYRIPVLAVNQIGGVASLIYEGGSMVFNRQGTLVERAALFAPEVRVADLVAEAPQSCAVMESVEEDLWRSLVLGTKDFVCKSGFKQVALGLSGGVDSALVAAIAAEALGPENVFGVLLPSPYSSEGSRLDALELAKNIGFPTSIMPIEDIMAAYAGTWRSAFSTDLEGLAAENLQARIRGVLLMAVSNAKNCMILTTSNKSESAVGYCTLYGDTCGGLAVIGDLYKTQVYKVCNWLNAYKGKPWIPEAILLKEPSAELRPCQKDSDSLPPYNQLDPLLYAVIEQGYDRVALLDAGYPADMVDQVLRLIQRSEFKRRQTPPILCVSAKSLGYGWNMPIFGGDW